MVNTASQFVGIITLDPTGRAVVALPDDFPDSERMSERSMHYMPFVITYQLTPVGKPMPNLYVSHEVCRYSLVKKINPSISNAKSLVNKSSKNLKNRDINDLNRSHNRQVSSDANLSVKSEECNDLQPTQPIELPKTSDLGDEFNGNRRRRISPSQITKSVSYSSLETSKISREMVWTYHDRLIDGPLPSSLTQALAITGVSISPVESLDSIAVTTSVSSQNSHNANGLGESKFVDSEKRTTISDSEHQTSSLDAQANLDALCFVINGGVAGSKVSWLVSTVPISVLNDRSDYQYGNAQSSSTITNGYRSSIPQTAKTENAFSVNQTHIRSSESSGSLSRLKLNDEDWRAIA